MPEAGSNVSTILGLISVVVLVTLNGFFVAAEFALVSVRRTRIEELIAQGVTSAQAVRKAIHDPDQFIAATQLGITLASLGLGWAGEPALSHVIDPVIALFAPGTQLSDTTAHTISAALAFAIITFLHVVVGELAPKSIALQRPEQTSLIVARPIMLAETAFRPAIWLLNGAGNLILRTLGFNPATGHELVHSVEEIKMLVAASTTHGLIEESEHEMLDAIFEMRQMNVRQVMIPRTEMVTISASATLRQLLELLKQTPYTKIPVYEKDKDHIIGIIYVRDIVDEIAKGDLDRPSLPFMRPAIYLPESTRIITALSAFRDGRQHLAIVLDEYGGTAGMVTLEDILEEISGEIPDQFEEDDQEIVKLPDGSWLVDGLANIEDVSEALNIDLNDENYDTIGGFVMGRLERIPEKEDEIIVDGYRFCVEKVDGMRIDKLRIVPDTGKDLV
jgi:putative hemolysin